MANRVRGQEVETLFAVDNVPQIATTDVRSFEMGWQLGIQKEGYLGETSDRRDSIYRGVSGSQEFHFENKAIFNIVTAFINKARRREPGVQINTKATINFGGGTKARVVVPDISAGEIPMNFGSRSDFGTIKFPWEAMDAQVI